MDRVAYEVRDDLGASVENSLISLRRLRRGAIELCGVRRTVTLAHVAGNVVGVHSWALTGAGGTLVSHFTRVGRGWCKRGIGTLLWTLSLSVAAPWRVQVRVVTVGGERLINRLTAMFNRVTWETG